MWLLVGVWGRKPPCNYAPFRGGARENPHKTATIWGPPRKIRKIAALSRPTPPVRNPPPPRFHTPVARRQVASSYKVRVVRPTGWPWRPPLAWRLATPLAPSDLRTEGCPMFHGTRPGWIEVIAGVMFSGKSEELIRRVRRAVIARKQVQVFKSHLDARYVGLYSVTSHDGETAEATPVDSSEEVMRLWRPETAVVAVDEVQFLDDGVVTVANTLAHRGVRVVLAGIDMGFRGLPFGPLPPLLALPE